MKRAMAGLIALALAVWLLPSVAGAAVTRTTQLTLVYGNDVRGELAPCG